MKQLRLILFIGALFLAIGCRTSQPETSNLSSEMEPGITQPPPPDPNKIAGGNPRHPENRKPRPVNPPGPPPEPTEPKPAAENSVVSTVMNEDGSITEFREFRDHQKIVKAEATWMDPREKKLKVFLRNGTVLESTTSNIPYLHQASSELILREARLRSRE